MFLKSIFICPQAQHDSSLKTRDQDSLLQQYIQLLHTFPGSLLLCAEASLVLGSLEQCSAHQTIVVAVIRHQRALRRRNRK